MRLFRQYIFLLAFVLWLQPAFSQISEGGRPLSFDYQSPVAAPSLILATPDVQLIAREDEQAEKQGEPQRVAVSVPVNADILDQGSWENYPGGNSICRLRLQCDGAKAMGLCFDDFFLPQGASLYIYTDDKDFVLGAYTARNNTKDGLFSVELVPGDALTLELDIQGISKEDVRLSVSELSYLYRFYPDFIDGRGVSDGCEVNINCPEGANWQKQKRGVVRIYVKHGAAYFWCSGSLLNNARLDRTPFLLTANHCAPDVSPEDLSNWVFYFNYEAPGCENPTSNPVSGTMTGAVLRANADATSGSDFMLIQLDADVPESYSPFYLGWNAENVAGEEGVTIHHPAGDIKKISTYTEPVTSSQWGSIPNTHWQVYWTETESGWGVTEGGSSGAPLINQNGMVIGTLTGGLAACEPGGGGPGTGPDKPDYYGKFSYSWDQNGTTPDTRLKDWLDPDNTGAKYLSGMNAVLTADFLTDNRLILAGNSVTFTDLSSGPPISWNWKFEGGQPESFTGKNPPAVTYAKGGKYNVELIVSDGDTYDTLVRLNYIEVIGQLFPNPTNSLVYIYLGEEVPSDYTVDVINPLGRVIYTEDRVDNESRLAMIDLSNLSSGVYIVRLQIKQRYLFSKVLLVHE